MGVTGYDLLVLEDILINHKPKTVLELGAQQNYGQPHLPAPYMRHWWEERNIFYRAIDISGEDNCGVMDLSKPAGTELGKGLKINSEFMERMSYDLIDEKYVLRGFDLVTDFGTSEHIGENGQFSWDAIYNCWFMKFHLCKIGGLIVSENPMAGNWPGHGFNYYTHNFYRILAQNADLEVLTLGNVAAMGNEIDGWNVLCVMKKTGDNFLNLETFKTLDLRLS